MPGIYEGSPHSVVTSNPAANAEATVTVPAGQKWLILSARITCAQGATQTPLVNLTVTDSAGNLIGNYPGSSAAQNASVTSTYDWFEGAALTAGAAATSNRGSIPRGLVVKGGMVIATSTTGKGANTDLTALTLHVLKG